MEPVGAIISAKDIVTSSKMLPAANEIIQNINHFNDSINNQINGTLLSSITSERKFDGSAKSIMEHNNSILNMTAKTASISNTVTAITTIMSTTFGNLKSLLQGQ